MRFDSLERIKKQEHKRSRAIRQRVRQERLKRTLYKQEYARAQKKAKKDYDLVQKEAQKFSQTKNLNQKINCTNDQKFLLALYLIAGKAMEAKKGREIDPVFVLHLYTASLAELNHRKSQVARSLLGNHSIDVLEGVQTWGQMIQRIEEVTVADTTAMKNSLEALQVEVTKEQRFGKRPDSDVVDELSMVHAQLSEIQTMMYQSPEMVQENASFFYYSLFRAGASLFGVAGSLAGVAAATGIGLFMMGAVILVSAAYFYCAARDLSEYQESWDTQMTDFRSEFGDFLGKSVEFLDYLTLIYSAGHASIKFLSIYDYIYLIYL